MRMKNWVLCEVIGLSLWTERVSVPGRLGLSRWWPRPVALAHNNQLCTVLPSDIMLDARNWDLHPKKRRMLRISLFYFYLFLSWT